MRYNHDSFALLVAYGSLQLGVKFGELRIFVDDAGFAQSIMSLERFAIRQTFG